MIFTLLLVFAGLCLAIMDELSSPDTFAGSRLKRFESPFFSDKLTTAGRKWKNGRPDDGEAFLFSSTLFVAFTDAWHLAKELMLLALSLAFALDLESPFVGFLFARSIIGLSFYVFYNLFNKTNYIMGPFKKIAVFAATFDGAKIFMAAITLIAVLFIGMATDAIDKLDPRFDPNYPDKTYLGDWLFVIAFAAGIIYLIVTNFRKPQAPVDYD